MATEAEIHSWLADYERDWGGLCQALMWQLANRFGTIVDTPTQAIGAFRTERSAERVHDGTPPPGAFLYWDWREDGHVGFMMNDGRVLMASHFLTEQWVDHHAGWITLDDYNDQNTEATYLGWSWRNGGNTCPFRDESTPVADVTKFRRFQSDGQFAVRTAFQRFPYVTNPRQENLAAGTGGLGLYSLTLNLSLDDFPADAQIEGMLVLEPTAGDTSTGYRFTVDGSPTGSVEAAIRANVLVESNASLYLELRQSAGQRNPLLTFWGADVANLPVE
ncbi:hypothetical protein PX701_09555 [Agromyces sp. H3Y2-19a]|jgi:hypothetical protein|uniref:hypothetical protein n=1 Tax=Agromyces TaxID=33877 RepID=UPI001E52C95F|nr:MULTISPECIES: hypothetical protein [Agromyces]MCD5344957.1 hypothetical protein [Agromyces sp. S2-1-8]MDF0513865.1 hypothetical protein [Agromyces chromiiresistens]